MELPQGLHNLEINMKRILLQDARGQLLATLELHQVVQDPALEQALMTWMEVHPKGIDFLPHPSGFKPFLDYLLQRAEKEPLITAEERDFSVPASGMFSVIQKAATLETKLSTISDLRYSLDQARKAGWQSETIDPILQSVDFEEFSVRANEAIAQARVFLRQETESMLLTQGFFSPEDQQIIAERIVTYLNNPTEYIALVTREAEKFSQYMSQALEAGLISSEEAEALKRADVMKRTSRNGELGQEIFYHTEKERVMRELEGRISEEEKAYILSGFGLYNQMENAKSIQNFLADKEALSSAGLTGDMLLTKGTGRELVLRRIYAQSAVRLNQQVEGLMKKCMKRPASALEGLSEEEASLVRSEVTAKARWQKLESTLKQKGMDYMLPHFKGDPYRYQP